MWKTLKEAASKHPRPLNRIQELYAFDANGWRRIKADPTPIVKTAAQNGDVKLRVVAPVRADADLSAFPSRGIDRSAHPNLTLFPDFFDLKKERHGGNPALSRWYFHFVKRVFDTMSDFDWFDKKQPGGGIPDNGSLDRGARHQFAVFGGEDSTTGQTFISRFLQLSGF